MKKILIFSLAYYPRHVSGAEAAIREITDRVSDIEFHMVTLRFSVADAPHERIGNVLVHRVGSGSYFSKMLFPLQAAAEARVLYRTYRFDALWALMTYMVLPVMFAKMLGVTAPHLLTLQDGDPYEKVFGRLRILPFLPLIDRGFRTARVIQVISTYLSGWPQRRGSQVPVVRIPNGANPRDIEGSVEPEAVEELHRRFDKAGVVYLINTARLEHQKGADTTIRALALLPPHVQLLLVGGGSEEPALKALVHKLNLNERIVFTGQVDRGWAAAYRKIAHIFVGPSRSEGLGNAFLSAMAAGLPVVATQEGGLADFITEQVAWPIPKDDPKAVAAAVQRILAEPNLAQEKAAHARELVEPEYTWDTVAAQMRTKFFALI